MNNFEQLSLIVVVLGGMAKIDQGEMGSKFSASGVTVSNLRSRSGL